MDRRNLLKGLLAIGIAAPLVRPTIEEIKEVPKKEVTFKIKGRDLKGVLYPKLNFTLYRKGKIIAEGTRFELGEMKREILQKGIDKYGYMNYRPSPYYTQVIRFFYNPEIFKEVLKEGDAILQFNINYKDKDSSIKGEASGEIQKISIESKHEYCLEVLSWNPKLEFA